MWQGIDVSFSVSHLFEALLEESLFGEKSYLLSKNLIIRYIIFARRFDFDVYNTELLAYLGVFFAQ